MIRECVTVTPPDHLIKAILTAIHGLCPTISSQTGFQNLLCNMTGAALHNLVLLVRQLEVRVAGWITVATGETVKQSDSLTIRHSHTTKQTLLERQETVKHSHSIKQTLLERQNATEFGFQKRQKTMQLAPFSGTSQEFIRMDMS